MLKNWFKIFLYNSKKNKLFFLLTIFGLATGLTGVILALSYWKNESAYNQWVPNKENIAEVIVEFNDNTWQWQVAPLGYHAKERSEIIEDYMYFVPWYSSNPVSYQGKNIFLKRIIDVQSNFFDFIPFDIVAGSKDDFKNIVNAIAIEEKQVFEIFKDEDPIGKTLKTPEGETYVVTTIFKTNSATSFQPNVIIKDLDKRIKTLVERDDWGSFSFGLLLKINDKNNFENVSKQLFDTFYNHEIKKEAKEKGVSPEEILKDYANLRFQLVSLDETRLNKTNLPTAIAEGKGNTTLLFINVGLSLLILIISIFNYINLSTAYAIKRAKEIGVRKALGASKTNIVSQQIFETFIISLIALIIALAMVEILLPYYNELLNKKIEINFIQFLPHFVATMLLVVLLAGVFPALYIANFDILKVLKGNFSRSKSGVWLRNGMIIVQFCIATFFIISGIIITEQVNYASTKDLGFRADQLISIGWDTQLGNTKYDTYLRIKQDLLKIPGVSDVSTSVFTPGRGSSSSSNYKFNEINVQAENMSIDFEYLKLLDIKIIEGRALNEKLASDSTKVVLLNKTAVQAFGDPQILGKDIIAFGEKVKVVGIVDDFHLHGLDTKIPSMVFSHIKFKDWTRSNISTITVKIEADKMEKAISQIETYWKKNVDEVRPFNYDFLDRIFAKTYKNYINQRNLFAILNIVVISIALLGLFAIASYSIERRYKEIAIKKVLGVETKQMIFNLSSQYFILLFIGYVLAIFPSYYLMNRWLSNFSYRIDIPVIAFVVAFFLMFILTAIIVIYKAFNATRMNVLTYLKYE